MPGDQTFKTNLLAAACPAEHPETHILHKLATPTTDAVTPPFHNDRFYAHEQHEHFKDPTKDHQLGNVYMDRGIRTTTATVGAKTMYSNLNPNAVEFVPSFKQQKFQSIKLNFVSENEKDILKENKLDLIEPDRIIEHIVQDVKNVGCLFKEENESTDLDDKIPVSEVQNTSIETVQIPNVPVELTELRDLCCKHIEADGKISVTNVSDKSSSEQNLSKEHSKENKNSENCKTETKACVDKRSSMVDCTANSVGLQKEGKEAGNVNSILKKASIENKNKFKEACCEANYSKNQTKTMNKVDDSKKNMNNVKISATPPTAVITGTSRKVSFAKTSTTVELKKDTQHKSEPKSTQSNSIKKSCRSNDTTSRKPSTTPQKTEMTKTPNRDTTSTSSAGKQIPNRFNPTKNKLICGEKPAAQGQNQTECATKAPRPTLSSKLRKAETQKRRNLFFDIDSIKMSEFLFK